MHHVGPLAGQLDRAANVLAQGVIRGIRYSRLTGGANVLDLIRSAAILILLRFVIATVRPLLPMPWRRGQSPQA
jgi:hypothetical protein